MNSMVMTNEQKVGGGMLIKAVQHEELTTVKWQKVGEHYRTIYQSREKMIQDTDLFMFFIKEVTNNI